MGPELCRLEEEKLLGPAGLARRNAPTPWWRDGADKPLDVSKVKDTTRYVMTGEKD